MPLLEDAAEEDPLQIGGTPADKGFHRLDCGRRKGTKHSNACVAVANAGSASSRVACGILYPTYYRGLRPLTGGLQQLRLVHMLY